jgi:NAD(P)-dependent dehydrogenase (short-subunit alcohol dehydrogenase family)
LITGGAGHIGSTLASAFLEKGSQVATADLESTPAIGAFTKSDRHHHFILDLGDPVGTADLVDKVVDRFGRLDVVVTTASWRVMPFTVSNSKGGLSSRWRVDTGVSGVNSMGPGLFKLKVTGTTEGSAH